MKFPEVGSSQQRTEGGGGGLFIKMGDGDKLTGVFRGDPAVRRVHWVQSSGTYDPCGGGDCGLCADGNKAKTRFKINIIVKDNNVYVAKIFDGSYGTYLELKALHEGGYDLEKTAVEITRKGTGTDTRFTILPLPPGRQPNGASFAAMAKVPSVSIEGRDVAPEQADPVAGEFNNSDIPF